MFKGLSAFPLTPIKNGVVNETAFIRIIRMLASSNVDSIGALGSTGSYAYLDTGARKRVAELAVENAAEIPVIVGVGAVSTSEVLKNVRGAEEAAAAGLLLAPMTYQPLTEDEVFELFRTVTDSTELPVVLYDNPGTTHFSFTTELYARIAALPGIASIKIPGLSMSDVQMQARVNEIRAAIPDKVTIGISGDAFAAQGIAAGCDAWYSVLAGTLPVLAQSISSSGFSGNFSEALAASDRLQALWNLYFEHGGSIRVMDAIAQELNLVDSPSCLPLPLKPISETAKATVREVLKASDVPLP